MREVALLAAVAAIGAALVLYSLIGPIPVAADKEEDEFEHTLDRDAVKADLELHDETKPKATVRRRQTSPSDRVLEGLATVATADPKAAAAAAARPPSPERRASEPAGLSPQAKPVIWRKSFSADEKQKLATIAAPRAALPLPEDMAELVESGDLCWSKGMGDVALHCYTDAVHLGAKMGTTESELGVRARTGAGRVQASLGHLPLAETSFGEARRIRKALNTIKTVDGGDSVSLSLSPLIHFNGWTHTHHSPFGMRACVVLAPGPHKIPFTNSRPHWSISAPSTLRPTSPPPPGRGGSVRLQPSTWHRLPPCASAPAGGASVTLQLLLSMQPPLGSLRLMDRRHMPRGSLRLVTGVYWYVLRCGGGGGGGGGGGTTSACVGLLQLVIS